LGPHDDDFGLWSAAIGIYNKINPAFDSTKGALDK
jgi:hypothetical protein